MDKTVVVVKLSSGKRVVLISVTFTHRTMLLLVESISDSSTMITMKEENMIQNNEYLRLLKLIRKHTRRGEETHFIILNKSNL